MIDYGLRISTLTNSIRNDFIEQINGKDSDLICDCFQQQFNTTWERELKDISFRLEQLINFLAIIETIEKLKNVTEEITKYQIAYSAQRLFGQIDASFVLEEANRYVEAQNEEKQLKQRLIKTGVPDQWIKKHFDTQTKVNGMHLPLRETNESLAHYMRRILSHSYGDFDEMMKIYINVTEQRDRQLYDNIKTLVAVMRTNGVNKTANDVYEYLSKNENG